MVGWVSSCYRPFGIVDQVWKGEFKLSHKTRMLSSFRTCELSATLWMRIWSIYLFARFAFTAILNSSVHHYLYLVCDWPKNGLGWILRPSKFAEYWSTSLLKDRHSWESNFFGSCREAQKNPDLSRRPCNCAAFLSGEISQELHSFWNSMSIMKRTLILSSR